MVVVATVRWNMDASKETSRSISRVLDVQYLHSTNKQKESEQKELRGEEEKLYEFVKQFVNEVSGFGGAQLAFLGATTSAYYPWRWCIALERMS